MIAADGQTRWHNGQTGGSRSALFSKLAVVVLCNTAVTNAVDQQSIKRAVFLQRRLLNDFISKNPLRGVSLLQRLAAGG